MRLFLEESANVSRPLWVVSGLLLDDESWLTPLASVAEEDGEVLSANVGPSRAGGLTSREVMVTLGPPRHRDETIVVPISWKAIELPRLLPVLDGDLVLAPVAGGRCRLSLFAGYEPPFSAVGRGDASASDAVALSTVRSFVSRVAEFLETTHRPPRHRRGRHD